MKANQREQKLSIVLAVTIGLTTAIALASGYCEVAWSGDDVHNAIETDCNWNEMTHLCVGGCTQDYYSHNEGCVMSAVLVDVHCANDTSRGNPPGKMTVNTAVDFWDCMPPEFEENCEGCDLSAEGTTISQSTEQIDLKKDVPGCGG